MDNKILSEYINYKEASLKGRYINFNHIAPLLNKYSKQLKLTVVGLSEAKRPIHLLTIGIGTTKVLAWSQMHGNESTTTRAVFDLLNYLTLSNDAKDILNRCTIYLIPMLNPDGSQLYTRINVNKIDLNRDAQLLDQEESKVFKTVVDQIKPDIAFNLHGQRTIFSTGNSNNSAIVSFLSPASDPKRSITATRKIGMRIISEMNKVLQTVIPKNVGRYDDGFNINCTGDTMEKRGVATILFEAGHHPNDYERETTRKWIYLALVTALQFIARSPNETEGYEAYFDIPENGKCFKDIIIRNLILNNSKVDVSIQYQEQLINNQLFFLPYVAEIESQIPDFGHLEFDNNKVAVSFSKEIQDLQIDDKIDFLIVGDEKFSEFPIKN